MVGRKVKIMKPYPLIGDRDIDRLSRMIHLPLVGHFYRHRFKMILDLLTPNVSKILEIGYAAGFLAYIMAPCVDEYLGIDIHKSASGVKRALRYHGLKNANFKIADARNLNGFSPSSFDTVISVSCLEHIPECDAVQQNIYRVLKPGGQAVYGIPVKNVFTRLLFQMIGYDDEKIHPTTHFDVIQSAAKAGMFLEEENLFPGNKSHRLGLYWAGRFRKLR